MLGLACGMDRLLRYLQYSTHWCLDRYVLHRAVLLPRNDVLLASPSGKAPRHYGMLRVPTTTCLAVHVQGRTRATAPAHAGLPRHSRPQLHYVASSRTRGRVLLSLARAAALRAASRPPVAPRNKCFRCIWRPAGLHQEVRRPSVSSLRVLVAASPSPPASPQSRDFSASATPLDPLPPWCDGDARLPPADDAISLVTGDASHVCYA